MFYEDFVIKGGVLAKKPNRAHIKKMDVQITFHMDNGPSITETYDLRRNASVFILECTGGQTAPGIREVPIEGTIGEPDVPEPEGTVEDAPAPGHTVEELPSDVSGSAEVVEEKPKRGRPAGGKK